MQAANTSFDRDRARTEFFDYCSREGSDILRQRIEAYWAARGMSVNVTLTLAPFHPTIRAGRFDVRSDMVNGMPRGSAEAATPSASVVVPFAAEDADVRDSAGDWMGEDVRCAAGGER